jgi:putative lipoic acid-binding regulatory protein
MSRFAMDQQWIANFREKLDQHYSWPSLYMFKFIIPTGRENEIKNLFPNHSVSEKLSREGKYTSVTIQMMMQSSDAVINIYVKASQIEGIVAL